MLTRPRAALIALAALALAACGNVHPGSAAVLDGRSISMDELDVAARNYCLLSLPSAKAQGVQDLDYADLRRQALTDMVTREVALELAEERGLAPDENVIRLTRTQRATVAREFPDQDVDELVQVIEENQELFELAAQIGADVQGETVTDENRGDLIGVGRQEITAAFSDHGVRFDPRFGLNRSGEAVAASGSLAAVTVDFEKPTASELPAERRCS